MATRTIRFMGNAYSTEGDVSVTVNFNGSEVYSGTVPTRNSEVPPQPSEAVQLFTFTVSTDVTGSVPMTISSSGGTCIFNDLIGNYTGYTLETDEAGDFVVVDGAYVVTVAPVDTYGDLNYNSAESDGKNSVVIDPDQGDGQSREVMSAGEEIGDWFYKIWNGSTLTCNFVIENTVIDVPTPTPSP